MKAAIVFFIVGFLLSAVLQDPAVRAEPQPEFTCNIRDEFSYYSAYNLSGECEKTLESHIVDIEFMDVGTGNHEITVVLSTREKLIFIRPLSALGDTPTNSSQAGKIFITAKSNGDYFGLHIGLNNTESSFDPMSVATLPTGQTEHPLNSQGQLSFELAINNSEPIDSCDFAFSPLTYGDFRIENLRLVSTDLQFGGIDYSGYYGAFCSLENVSKGNGRMKFDASANSLSGTVNIEVTAVQRRLHTPIECHFDGSSVNASEYTQAEYSTGSYMFHLQQGPTYYYGDEAQYCLNFTAPQTFQLRIDAENREEIDYLVFSVLPNNFSVSQMDFLGDEPCYAFTFNMPPDSKCLLGLDLKSKGWFLDPENMSLAEIPANIKEKYLNPSASSDGQHFDTNDTYVQKWASQVSRNQTNPFIIAVSIFQNITETLHVPPNWQELEGQVFNESVTQILNARTGVCRHFARAYAALCICSGLPARTVVGTAFSYLNETCKKNHEWVEAYMPGYGWITMDPTWGQEFLLDDKHASVTFWDYIQNSLNVTSANATLSAQAKLDSESVMTYLLKSCEQLVNNSQNSQKAEILIDQAKLMVDQGEIHDALINIARAYILASSTPPTQGSPFEGLIVPILVLLSVVAVAVIILYKSKKMRGGIPHKKSVDTKPTS
jgi:hypothetical protein